MRRIERSLVFVLALFLPAVFRIIERLSVAEEARREMLDSITIVFSRFLVRSLDSTEREQALVNSQSELDAAKNATQVVLAGFTLMLLMAWTAAAFTQYQTPITIYGIALAGAGSLLLAGTDFLESHPDSTKADNFAIQELIRRGGGYYLFGFGFTAQIIALFLMHRGVQVQILSIEHANLVYAAAVSLAGIVFLRIQDLVLIFLWAFLLSLAFISVFYSTFTIFGALGGLLSLFGAVVLTSVGFISYVAWIVVQKTRSGRRAMFTPFEFEEDDT